MCESVKVTTGVRVIQRDCCKKLSRTKVLYYSLDVLV